MPWSSQSASRTEHAASGAISAWRSYPEQVSGHESHAPTPTTEGLTERLHAARLASFLSRGGAADVEPTDDLGALLAKAGDVYAAAINRETRAAYARRWRLFKEWCESRDLESLPAQPETVMLYLTDRIGSGGAALSTIRGWSAAIARVHLEAGHASPSDDPAMSMFLRGLSRVHPRGPAPEPVQALRIGPLRDVCRAIDAASVDPTALRDRAILALHSIGVGDREMSRLCWEEVRLTEKQVKLTLLPIQHRRGRSVTARWRRDDPACPVAALQAWRHVVGATCANGPVLGLIDGGRISSEPLKPRRIFQIRKSRVEALGDGDGRAAIQRTMALLGDPPPMHVRDRAILLLGFAGAFRRNEVTRLRWSDLRFSDAGLTVRLRRSKTDPQGRGRDVGIPYGKSPLTCPVTALLRWKQCVQDQLASVQPEGLVFVHVRRTGRISEEPLTPEGLTRVVSRRADAAGLDGKWGGRSLRAGFISTAADLEVPLEAIASQSRHATLDSLVLYVRRQDPFRRNPAANVGL